MCIRVHPGVSESFPPFAGGDHDRRYDILAGDSSICIRADLRYKQWEHPVVFPDGDAGGASDIPDFGQDFRKDQNRLAAKKKKEFLKTIEIKEKKD
jgi:hypothetical protein